MVTDGEISPPSQAVLDRLERARTDLGLEVPPLIPKSPAYWQGRTVWSHVLARTACLGAL